MQQRPAGGANCRRARRCCDTRQAPAGAASWQLGPSCAVASSWQRSSNWRHHQMGQPPGLLLRCHRGTGRRGPTPRLQHTKQNRRSGKVSSRTRSATAGTDTQCCPAELPAACPAACPADHTPAARAAVWSSTARRQGPSTPPSPLGVHAIPARQRSDRCSICRTGGGGGVLGPCWQVVLFQ